MRRIEVNQLRRGMYVEAVQGGGLDPSLPRARFLLTTDGEVERLRRCGAEYFVINTTKGLDADKSCSKASTVKSVRETIDKSTLMLARVFDNFKNGPDTDISEIEPVVSMVSRSIDDNPSVFLNITRLKSKDEVTFLHSLSVSALMVLFGRYLGFKETLVQDLGMAGLVHDVGKLEICDDVLNKEGQLTDAEFAMIRSHPKRGHDILLRQKGVSDLILDVCLNHHEKINGKGYPGMLADSQITPYARLAAICDVYDAVTSARPYKTAWPPAQALKWMLSTEGHFDKKLLKKFVICVSMASEARKH